MSKLSDFRQVLIKMPDLGWLRKLKRKIIEKKLKMMYDLRYGKKDH